MKNGSNRVCRIMRSYLADLYGLFNIEKVVNIRNRLIIFMKNICHLLLLYDKSELEGEQKVKALIPYDFSSAVKCSSVRRRGAKTTSNAANTYNVKNILMTAWSQ